MMQRIEIQGLGNAQPFPPLWERVVKQPLVVRLRFNLAESTPNKNAKIIGIAGFGAIVSYRRVIRGSWDDWKNIERENSDRITALWKPDRVILRTYPYIRGSGPTTDRTSHSAPLITVPRDPNDPDWTRVVAVSIAPGMIMAVPQDGWTEGVIVKYDTPSRSRYQWLLWGHARNGGEFLMQDEKLVYEIEVL